MILTLGCLSHDQSAAELVVKIGHVLLFDIVVLVKGWIRNAHFGESSFLKFIFMNIF